VAFTTSFPACLRRNRVPEISRFLGIVIYILYRDHAPPHFHAQAGEYEVTVEIETGVVTGRFPPRALSALLEWRSLHLTELRQNWNHAMKRQPLLPIQPLE